MTRARRSGLSVSEKDVPLILAMIAREDRKHDIAAWFGLNQGRVADVEAGKYGSASLASGMALPPSGSPGPKAREIRGAAEKIVQLLDTGDYDGAKKVLAKAIKDFDKNV